MAHVHQILLYRGENSAGTFKMLKVVWSGHSGKKRSFWMVFQIQTQHHLSWRFWMLGHPIDEENRWKCQSVVKNRIAVCKFANMLGISLGSVQDVLKGSENVSDCCQICACLLSEEWRRIASTCAKIFKRVLKGPRNSFRDNHRWWDLCLLAQPRNQATVVWVEEPVVSMPTKGGMFTQLLRVCILFFSTFTELFMENLFHNHKR
jgi:hypothetical protein